MRRFSIRKATTGLAGFTGAAMVLTACGQTAGDPPENPADGKVQVVTSTNVYGDIAETIGGDNVEVTAIVDSLSQDPHSYEATVQDKLAVSEAELVVENGGGYDSFLHLLADDVELDHDFLITAVDVSGLAPEGEEHAGESGEEHAGNEHAGEEAEHDHGSFNEHVWYSLPAMSALADSVEEKLAELDSANAAAYAANADAFRESIAELEGSLEELHARTEGQSVAITEPVPLYLLEAAGLQNATPAEFSQAVEEGTDASVAALHEMRLLLQDGSVTFLAYNEQTEGPQTQGIRDVAEAAGVPVVNFTETIPEGENFISWMETNVANISDALAQG